MPELRSLAARLRRLGRRLLAVFSGRDRDAAMAEEIRLHLELQAEEHMRAGLSPAAAAERARRDFGHLDGIKERCRDERAFRWVAELGQDLRYGLRMLARSPGFTAVALGTLALGVGVNTGIFSLTDAVLLKQLPVRDPAGLVLFRWASPKDFPVPVNGSFEQDADTRLLACASFPTPIFERFKERSDLLEGVAAYCGISRLTVLVDGQAESVAQGELVSGGYFDLLGVSPAIGRLLEAQDDQPRASAVAVISHAYWVRRFDADPGIVGKVLRVNGASVVVVGVTDSRFTGTLEVGDHPDVYLPLGFSAQMGQRGLGEPDNVDKLWWLQVLGRRRAGVARSQMTAALEGILRQGAEASLVANAAQVPPAQGRSLILIASPGSQGLTEIRSRYRTQLHIMAALGAAILAIACANLANLLLARGLARQREIGVRLAIGASRPRIIRQLFAESALLAVLGGVLALPVAYWTARSLVAMQPQWEGHDLVLATALDGHLYAAAALISAATALIFGAAPALRASSVNVTAEFQGGSQTRGGAPHSRLSKVFLTVQIALSLMLLVGAGLLGQTLRNLDRADVGFDRDNLILFELDPNPSGADFAAAAAVNRDVIERLAAVPGVKSATFSKMALLSGRGWSGRYRAQGAPVPAQFEFTAVNAVGPGYFATYGIPVLRGRDFTAGDRSGPTVAIINEAMAKACFGQTDPVGRFLEGEAAPGHSFQVEVVGVARDTDYDGVRRGPIPTAFFDFGFSQSMASAQATMAIRVAGNPAAIVPLLRQAVHRAYPLLPVVDLRTQAAQIDALSANERMLAGLSTLFGVLGLGLVSLGLYGVLSYTVQRRTSEIGLRVALGATTPTIITMVLGECISVVTVGVVLGLVGSIAAVRLIASLLFGLSATDPATIAGCVLLLFAVALLSGWIPARRAARCDPAHALRCD